MNQLRPDVFFHIERSTRRPDIATVTVTRYAKDPLHAVAEARFITGSMFLDVADAPALIAALTVLIEDQ